MIVSTEAKSKKHDIILSQTDIQKKIQSRQAYLKIWLSSSMPKPLDKAALELKLQPRCCLGTIVLLTQYSASEVSRIGTKLKSLFSLLGLLKASPRGCSFKG
jgi:hypothetical protein